MPASRIDEAVRRFMPEPVLCWRNGQGLESRYSSSATSAGGLGGGRRRLDRLITELESAA